MVSIICTTVVLRFGNAALMADKYLTTQNEINHVMDLLLQCELFTYHDARMVMIMMADAQEVSIWF